MAKLNLKISLCIFLYNNDIIPNGTVHRFIMGDDITINVAFIGNKEKGYIKDELSML